MFFAVLTRASSAAIGGYEPRRSHAAASGSIAAARADEWGDRDGLCMDGVRGERGNLTFCEAFGRSHVFFSEPNIQTPPGNAQTFSVAMPSRSFLTGT